MPPFLAACEMADGRYDATAGSAGMKGQEIGAAALCPQRNNPPTERGLNTVLLPWLTAPFLPHHLQEQACHSVAASGLGLELDGWRCRRFSSAAAAACLGCAAVGSQVGQGLGEDRHASFNPHQGCAWQMAVSVSSLNARHGLCKVLRRAWECAWEGDSRACIAARHGMPLCGRCLSNSGNQ